MHGHDLLSAQGLLAAAGSTSFARGKDYVRRVQRLRSSEGKAQASIRGSDVYDVDLDWSRRRLVGGCTCPHFARGNFCKHLVALGLAVLDSADGPLTAAVPSRSTRPGQTVHAPSAEVLLLRVNEALRTRGHIDYRRSFEVAADAQEVLDELEDHLDAGAREGALPALLPVLLPALQQSLTRLRAITENADDSSGSIGDACQRAADLFARACCAGHPEPVQLARWLVKFRNRSQGWPETTLPYFIEAFDGPALSAYRQGVAALHRKHEQTDQRFELDRMCLELADHDGDVDLAVEVLSRGEHPQYAAIVDRLRLAGRLDDVTVWVDRGVAAGRVSLDHSGSRNYWLDPEEVAGEYLALDRVTDAVEVFRDGFTRRPDLTSYAALVAFAGSIGLEEENRTWALQRLRTHASRAPANAALLVQIALAEDDLDAAWQVADEFGPGHAWQSLAAASADVLPSRAAALHRAEIDDLLRFTDASRYAAIAHALATVRELSLRAGEERDFAAYLTDIRTTYRRRPALMSALARRGL